MFKLFKQNKLKSSIFVKIVALALKSRVNDVSSILNIHLRTNDLIALNQSYTEHSLKYTYYYTK